MTSNGEIEIDRVDVFFRNETPAHTHTHFSLTSFTQGHKSKASSRHATQAQSFQSNNLVFHDATRRRRRRHSKPNSNSVDFNSLSRIESVPIDIVRETQRESPVDALRTLNTNDNEEQRVSTRSNECWTRRSLIGVSSCRLSILSSCRIRSNSKGSRRQMNHKRSSSGLYALTDNAAMTIVLMMDTSGV
jgi:hypothetical protein